MAGNQHSDNSVARLNNMFRRLADALQRRNEEWEYERALDRVRDAMNERAA